MSFEQAISDVGVELERDLGLADAQHIIREVGSPITIRLHTETTITRDRFNSIKRRSASDLTFYAFPIVFNPTAKQLEDFGMREYTEVLIKTAMLDWTAAGYSMETLSEIDSIRATVIIDGAKYEIKTKQLDSQYKDTFLYVHLGLNRV